MLTPPDTSTSKRKSPIRHIVGVLVELAFNVALPVLIYTTSRSQIGDVNALLLASAPAVVWSLGIFIRERKVDAISLLVLTGIILSLIGFVGGGGVKLLQLRENLVTGIIGAIFLGSVAINKPLILQLARAGTRRASPSAFQAFDALSQDPQFHHAMRLASLIWAVGLIAAAAVNCALVFALPIETFMLVSAPISYVTIALLTAHTYWYVPKAIKAAKIRLGLPDAPKIGNADEDNN